MIDEILYSISIPTIFLFSLILLIGVAEIGYRNGRAWGTDGATESLMEFVPTSLLALLALLTGFAFSMALTRFDHRKAILVQETNAIETSWLRAGLLSSPETEAARTALVRYLDHRLHFSQSFSSPIGAEQYSRENDKLTASIWQITNSAGQRDRTPITGLFVTSINQMIDLATERTFAVQDHVPEMVYIALLGIALLAIYFLSRIYGYRQHKRTPLFLLAFTLCAVLTMIHDLDRPFDGLIKVEPGIMRQLKVKLQDTQAPAK